MGVHRLSLQFSVPFSQGSVIERRKLEKLPQVEKESQNSFIFLVTYKKGKANWEQMRGPEGVVFMSIHVYTKRKNTNKCVCGNMLCKCPGWQWQ